MYDKVLEISEKLNSKFFFNYDISKLTWFRAGGKTDVYCVISDEYELEIILNNIGNIIVEAQKKTINSIDDLEAAVNVAIKSKEKTLLIVIYNNKNQRRYIGVKLD